MEWERCFGEYVLKKNFKNNFRSKIIGKKIQLHTHAAAKIATKILFSSNKHNKH